MTTASYAARSAIFGLESLAEEDEAPDEVVALAVQRMLARATRDFDEADRLRAEIESAGWDVRDEADTFRLVRRR